MGGLVHGLLPVVPVPLCRLSFAVATHTTSQDEKGSWNKKARGYCQGPAGNACIDLFRLQALQRSRRSSGWSRGPLGFIPGIFSPLVPFSYLQVYCLNLVFLFPSVFLLVIFFILLLSYFPYFFNFSIYFFSFLLLYFIYLQIHFDLIIAPAFRFYFVMLLFTLISFCLYLLHIPFLSLPFPHTCWFCHSLLRSFLRFSSVTIIYLVQDTGTRLHQS